MSDTESLVRTVLPLLGGVAAYFFIVPLLIGSTLKFKVGPSVIPCEFTDTPQAVQSFLTNADNELERAGFERLGTYVIDDYVPNAIMILAVYRHEQTSDLACSAFTTPRGNSMEGKLVNTLVEIQREFRIGDHVHTISTCNSDDLGIFRVEPYSAWFRMTSCGNLGELYKLHLAITDDLIGPRHCVESLADEFDNDCVRYLSEGVLDKTSACNAAYGLLALNANRDRYAPSFVGMFLLVWSELPPIKQIRKWCVRRRGRAIQSKLDAGWRVTADDATTAGERLLEALT